MLDYDKSAMKTIGVDPEKFGWFNQDYSQYPVDPHPVLAPQMLASPAGVQTFSVPELIPYVDPRPPRALKPVLLAVSLVFLLIFVGVSAAIPYAAYAVSGGTAGGASLLGVSIFCGLAAAFISLVGTLCFSRSIWLKIPGFVLASIPVLNIGTAITNQNFDYATVLSVATAMGFLFGLMFTKSLPYKQRVKAPKTVYRTETREVAATYHAPRYYPASGDIHGTPGGVAGSTGTFSQEAINAGVKGEQNTAEMLKLLFKIPGTSIFHGLKFPGSKTADVDHAVSHGDIVYLLDSKMYRAGTYQWDAHEEKIVSSGSEPKDNHMDSAARGYRNQLFGYRKIVPMVIVHGRNIAIGPNRWSANGVGLFTAEEAIDFMGTQMSASMTTWRDNPALRGSLVDSMKH